MGPPHQGEATRLRRWIPAGRQVPIHRERPQAVMSRGKAPAFTPDKSPGKGQAEQRRTGARRTLTSTRAGTLSTRKRRVPRVTSARGVAASPVVRTRCKSKYSKLENHSFIGFQVLHPLASKAGRTHHCFTSFYHQRDSRTQQASFVGRAHSPCRRQSLEADSVRSPIVRAIRVFGRTAPGAKTPAQKA